MAVEVHLDVVVLASIAQALALTPRVLARRPGLAGATGRSVSLLAALGLVSPLHGPVLGS